MNLNALDKPDTGAPIEEDAGMMPLGTGDFGGDEAAPTDPLAGIGDEYKVRSGALVIVVVIALAAGVLITMKVLSGSAAPRTANAGDLKAVDEWINGRSAAALGKQNDLLASLDQDYSEHQVPLANLKDNPFELRVTGSSSTTPAHTTKLDPKQEAERLIEERKQKVREQFDRAANGLTLQSTMLGGSRPMASLSNQIVLAGDTFVYSDVEFKVIDITAESATVMAENRELGVVVTHTVSIRRN